MSGEYICFRSASTWNSIPDDVVALETLSEGGYGINTQVEKFKNMTIVKFMECDSNKLI